MPSRRFPPFGGAWAQNFPSKDEARRIGGEIAKPLCGHSAILKKPNDSAPTFWADHPAFSSKWSVRAGMTRPRWF